MKFIFHISIFTLGVLGVSHAYAQEGQADVSAAPQAAEEAAAPADMDDEFAIEPEEGDQTASVKKPAKAGEIKVDPLDPISGTVGLSEVPFYDFYERRVRYKKADKEYRQSIEARREGFAKPETEKRLAAEARLEQIYKDEANPKAASFTKAPAPAIEEGAKGWKSEDQEKSADPRPVVPVGQPGDGVQEIPQVAPPKEDSVSIEEEEKAENVPPSVTPPSDPAKVEAVPKGSAVPPDGKPPVVVDSPKQPVKEIPIEATPKDDEAAKKVVVPADAPDFEKSPFGE